MDSDETLKALSDQMAEFAAKLEEAKTALAPIKDEEMKLNSAKYQLQQEFNARMIEINNKAKDLQDKSHNAEIVVNSLEQQLKTAEYKANQIKEEIAAKKKAELLAEQEKHKYETLSKQFETATIGAPWREWAKDHQIKAGHKIAMDRYVILADPMGLGKTLSSIVTSDIVEQVTKEASEEWPFLGVEKEVYVPDQYFWTAAAVEAAENGDWPFNGNWGTQYIDGFHYFNNSKIEEGNTFTGFLNYDVRNRWVENGIFNKTLAHHEKKIVNSIERPVGRKVLYFCPSPLLRNVLEEWQRWSPHRSVTYIGNMSKAERNFVLDHTLPHLKEYVIIINYEAWRRDKQLLHKLSECKFDTIIIDEAHNIKDMKSGAYKGVKTVIDNCKPEYVIPMTGTPILNRPQELFSILTLVNQEEFAHERDFLYRYCEEYETNTGQMKWRFRAGGLDALAKKISKNFMRRTKDQAGIKLPEKTIIYHELDVDPEKFRAQAKARKQMKEFATLIIDEKAGKAIQATVMIALITRLRQIETWPAGIIQRDKLTKEIIMQVDVEESQKIDYIIRKEEDEWEGLIPDTVEDERIVVFSQFKAPLHELKRRVEAAGYRAVILDGDTSSDLRDEIRHDFDRSVTPNRTDSKWDVLLANYKAAGVGLNLTNATQLITLDEEWNPGKREQAWDRIHRIGQTQNVTINVIRTKNTIDTWLADIIDDKAGIVGGFETAMMDVDDFKKFLEDDTGLL